MKPVAVAVVTWNSAEVLPGLIASLPAGAGDVPYRLVVVDNASSDDTVAVARRLAPDVTVAVRMDAGNVAALDYYVLPRIDMTEPRLRLAESNGLSLDGYRFDDLDFFFSLAARAGFAEAA